MQTLNDLTPKELIGKYVIINDKSISKIDRVTKKYFGVVGSNDLFELRTGRLRGGSTWHVYWASLIDEDEAKKTIILWKEKREKKEMIENIILKIKNDCIPHEKIKKILELLNN